MHKDELKAHVKYVLISSCCSCKLGQAPLSLTDLLSVPPSSAGIPFKPPLSARLPSMWVRPSAPASARLPLGRWVSVTGWVNSSALGWSSLALSASVWAWAWAEGDLHLKPRVG